MLIQTFAIRNKSVVRFRLALDDFLQRQILGQILSLTFQIKRQRGQVELDVAGQLEEPRERPLDALEDLVDHGVAHVLVAVEEAAPEPVEAHTSGLMIALLVFTTVLAICGGLTVIAVSKQRSDSLTKWFAEKFGPPVEVPPKPVAPPVDGAPAETPK